MGSNSTPSPQHGYLAVEYGADIMSTSFIYLWQVRGNTIFFSCMVYSGLLCSSLLGYDTTLALRLGMSRKAGNFARLHHWPCRYYDDLIIINRTVVACERR